MIKRITKRLFGTPTANRHTPQAAVDVWTSLHIQAMR